MAKKKALGRGLSAVLDSVEQEYIREMTNGADMVVDIAIDEISPNPYQPRTDFDEARLSELAESIERHGLIQPIIVIAKEDGYQIIAGERRFRASQMLGNSTIKAIVADIGDQNLRELALIENIQRQDLNPIELATAYSELIDEYQITQQELANIVKKSRSEITNTLRLLNLSSETQEAIKSGQIKQGHAKIMVGLAPEDEQKVRDTIIGQNLSAHDTEFLVKRIKTAKKSNKEFKFDEKNYNKEMIALKSLLDEFGRASINGNAITIKFDEISHIKALIAKIKQKI